VKRHHAPTASTHDTPKCTAKTIQPQQQKSFVMKKYTTPLLMRYSIVTEGLMNISLGAPGSSAGKVNGDEADTFEKQFSIWGDDPAADDMDFNSTGIF